MSARPDLDDVTYRTRITLGRSTWERLQRECEERGISGRVLIQWVLSDFVRQLKNPVVPPVPLQAPDDERPDDPPESAMAKLYRYPPKRPVRPATPEAR